MSTITERLTTIQASNTNWQLPVRLNAVGGYYFDSGQTAGSKDYADVSLGSPTFTGSGFTWNTGYLTIDNRAAAGCYIVLPYKDPVSSGTISSDLSVAMVVRANSAANNAFVDSLHQPIFFSSLSPDNGNTTNPGNKGPQIQVTSPGTLTFTDYELVGGTLTKITVTLTGGTTQFDNFQFILATRRTTGGVTTRTLQNLTAGTAATPVASTGVPITGTSTSSFLQIGGNHLNTQGGLMDITFAEVVSRVIATTEIYSSGTTGTGRIQRRALGKTSATI